MSSDSQGQSLASDSATNEEQITLTPSMSTHSNHSTSTLEEERKWNNVRESLIVTVNTIYELADGSFNRRGLSLARYLDSAKAMNKHLTMHHTIEERYIFPILGEAMPQFAARNNGAHITSHRDIHEGLERLEVLVKKWTDTPSEYSPDEMRACLDNFRDVLFRHLDEEVEDLRGENLKKYITLETLQSIPI